MPLIPNDDPEGLAELLGYLGEIGYGELYLRPAPAALAAGGGGLGGGAGGGGGGGGRGGAGGGPRRDGGGRGRLPAVPALRRAAEDGLRLGQSERRPDVHRRGAGRRGGPPGIAFRRPRRRAADADHRGDRLNLRPGLPLRH